MKTRKARAQKMASSPVVNLARLAEILDANLTSANEFDSNGEIANIVDGLYAIARALTFMGKSILVVNSMDVGDVEAKLGLVIPGKSTAYVGDPYNWKNKKGKKP